MLLNRMKENKNIIISRLNNEDKTTSIEQLRDLLKARHEDSTGTKAELMRPEFLEHPLYMNNKVNLKLSADSFRDRMCLRLSARMEMEFIAIEIPLTVLVFA